MDISTHILVESRLHGDQYTIRFNTQKMRTFLEKMEIKLRVYIHRELDLFDIISVLLNNRLVTISCDYAIL